MERQPRLVDALLTEAQKDLYLRSAHFRNAVATLSSMLPAMVDGLAADAEKRDEATRERVDLLSRGLAHSMGLPWGLVSPDVRARMLPLDDQTDQQGD
jgi:hypothetical protein